jgi:hypothetical protein
MQFTSTASKGRVLLGGTMNRNFVRFLAVLPLAALAACASNIEIPFDHSANTNIKTIGILTPHMDSRPQMVLASDIGQSFGLIGALVDVSMAEARNNKFEAILTASGDHPTADLLTDLKGTLEAHGYKTLDVAADRPDVALLKSYPKPGDNAVDAYLDVSIVSYGYVAAGIANSNPYRPFVSAKVRLVRASDSAVLMEDTVLYNPVSRNGITPEKAVTISPDTSFAYPDFDTLTASPNAVKGIDTSLKSTADAIGTLVQ